MLKRKRFYLYKFRKMIFSNNFQKAKNKGMMLGIIISVFTISFFVFAWSESPINFIEDKVGIGTADPQEKLEVAGNIKAEGVMAPRAIKWITGHHHDTTCDVNAACGPSPLSARVLTFTKTRNDTGIRVLYNDSMRSYSADGTTRACQWHIYFNGAPCPSGDIRGATYSEAGAGHNKHRNGAVGGVCSGQSAGEYTIQVYVSNVSGYQARCWTGWNSTFHIEAEEVLLP
jgi:hypothetical protein